MSKDSDSQIYIASTTGQLFLLSLSGHFGNQFNSDDCSYLKHIFPVPSKFNMLCNISSIVQIEQNRICIIFDSFIKVIDISGSQAIEQTMVLIPEGLGQITQV